jgi:hypothetical protein
MKVNTVEDSLQLDRPASRKPRPLVGGASQLHTATRSLSVLAEGP